MTKDTNQVTSNGAPQKSSEPTKDLTNTNQSLDNPEAVQQIQDNPEIPKIQVPEEPAAPDPVNELLLALRKTIIESKQHPQICLLVLQDLLTDIAAQYIRSDEEVINFFKALYPKLITRTITIREQLQQPQPQA